MRLFSGIFTLLVGLLISCVAAYFSIVGLAALFASAGISIILMGASLEIGKITAASWLKAYWGDRSVSMVHKSYLMVAIVALMAITSVGIYGFLSAGHLEQQAPAAGIAIESQQYETKLSQRQSENDRLTKRLDQIDQNISSFISQGAASRGLQASQSLKRERDQIAAQIEANNQEINGLNEKLIPLRTKSSMVEAKLGPVKYLADLIGYGDDPEAAVRLVIVLIMIPFDPLAVVLVLSGMITINQWRGERNRVVPEDASTEVLEEIPSTSNDQAETVPAPVEINVAHTIPIGCNAEAVVETPEVPTDDKGKMTREDLLDLLEQNPTIVNEMISTILNDVVINKTPSDLNKTPSDLTGGRFE